MSYNRVMLIYTQWYSPDKSGQLWLILMFIFFILF